MDLLVEITRGKRVPKPPPPPPVPNRPLASPPRIFISMENIKNHMVLHQNIPIELTEANPQWNNGKAVVEAYHRQAANMALHEQEEYKQLIDKGYYWVNESAATKPSNHVLDRLIKNKATWPRYVFLHALFPARMDSINKRVRKELEDLDLNDYSALYRQAKKGDTGNRPSYNEIKASEKAAVEARKAQIKAEVEQRVRERELRMKEQERQQERQLAERITTDDDDSDATIRPTPTRTKRARHLPTHAEPTTATAPTLVDKGTQTKPFEDELKKRVLEWTEKRFMELVQEHGAFLEEDECFVTKKRKYNKE